ncbi:hypothetical protein D4764_01G0013630 [Takifugu flavidus]|uniref:Uncharacterized protein n=1 Tax=Takifugu flavidus TaxID=433684 RepID=A0A5C6PRV5_9TELE|nr:hypothetical protein D4764_01G0013630 [Takifugu flavidus]
MRMPCEGYSVKGCSFKQLSLMETEALRGEIAVWLHPRLRNSQTKDIFFSLSGLSPLTQLDHQNTSETHQRSAYLNRRALKYRDRPCSLFKLHPSSSSIADQTPRTRRFSFHQRSLQQTGQAFPVGGT